MRIFVFLFFFISSMVSFLIILKNCLGSTPAIPFTVYFFAKPFRADLDSLNFILFLVYSLLAEDHREWISVFL